MNKNTVKKKQLTQMLLTPQGLLHEDILNMPVASFRF